MVLIHTVCATNKLEWPRLSCFRHNLNLEVAKALKDDHRIKRTIGLARKLVSAPRIVGGASKVREKFYLQQIKLCMAKDVIEMCRLLFMELISLDI